MLSTAEYLEVLPDFYEGHQFTLKKDGNKFICGYLSGDGNIWKIRKESENLNELLGDLQHAIGNN